MSDPDQQRPNHASPYPVSRLSPPVALVDLAQEVAAADRLLSGVAEGKLRLIAEQIRALQQQARQVLEETRQQQDLHHVECSFKRLPGHTYHLYRRPDGSRYFSMLAPADWGDQPPHPYQGGWRLGHDLSWQPAESDSAATDPIRTLLAELGAGVG